MNIFFKDVKLKSFTIHLIFKIIKNTKINGDHIPESNIHRDLKHQLAEYLSSLGYNVQVEANLGSKRIDVLAEKDNEIKLIEVVNTHRPQYTLEALSIDPKQDSRTIGVSKKDIVPYLSKLHEENSKSKMMMREIRQRLIQTYLSMLDHFSKVPSVGGQGLLKIYDETFGEVCEFLSRTIPPTIEEKENVCNQLHKVLHNDHINSK